MGRIPRRYTSSPDASYNPFIQHNSILFLKGSLQSFRFAKQSENLKISMQTSKTGLQATHPVLPVSASPGVTACQLSHGWEVTIASED
jgi:hypothetical protein